MSEVEWNGEGRLLVKFDDIAVSVTERVDDPSAAGVTAYVGLDHLDSDTLKISRWGSPSDVESTKLRFYPGDVIYARRRAYQRKLGVAEFEGICSAHALVLRARPETCLPGFLPYFLQSDQFHTRALAISVGSLSPTINWKTLAIQKFTLPPLDEQAHIVDALDAVNLAREQTQQVNTSMLRTALWAEFSCSNGTSGESVRVGDILNLEYGKALKESVRKGGSVPVLGSSGVVGFHDSPLVNEPAGIVVGRKGSAGAVIWIDGPFWPIDTTYYVVMKREDVSLRLAYELLKHLNLPTLSAQTAVPGLNRDAVHSIGFVLPRALAQGTYLRKLAGIDSFEGQLAEWETRSKELSISLRESLLEGKS